MWENPFHLDAARYVCLRCGTMTPAATMPLVLIADDVRDTREMYALYLNMLGYNVDTAEDGHEAVVKARALAPRLTRPNAR
jgi:PleD family two-component response regulator